MIFSACPAPILDHKTIVLGHGSGGKLTHQLIQKMILPAFRNPALETQHDGAVLPINGGRIAFSADSYVVNPIFFPGGNIGDLAINGTVNDLAMCGAQPQYLSASFIIEEGLAMDDFWRILCSMKEAAEAAGVSLVTGDTKVVDRGKARRMHEQGVSLRAIKRWDLGKVEGLGPRRRPTTRPSAITHRSERACRRR